ncbi:hypothetical protein BZA05DRAFT_369131 [Tricharina praecox]|uniref:uncharacterized protein n=1 Tax=Tricharina praecox TaxID=43433 RepID=UPI0022203C6F|nr:uncharacterized protein BZA05DRAFT_369131 [Tricharina praecox]KAI5855640.1 hypothetical protein BZA05DRAFT_369131 [Tricharina praecox]
MADESWLSLCTPSNIPMPPLERYIHHLPHHILKKRLGPHELGVGGYIPDHSTLKYRDENEVLALELVRNHTNIPVPDLVYMGADFNVFTRIPGICVNHQEIWDTISPRQREGLQYQIRSYIRQLSHIPSPYPGHVHSPHPSGSIFRPYQLQHCGPFPSTSSLLLHNPHLSPLVSASALPVFAHMDWDLSNIIIAENGDAVVGVVDWERAAWFPDAGRAMHRCAHHWEGWEGLFDTLEFPVGGGGGEGMGETGVVGEVGQLRWWGEAYY